MYPIRTEYVKYNFFLSISSKKEATHSSNESLPVIVSESVGAIELLHNDVDSIIVDPENVEEVSDVVLKLMNDKDYYNKISQNACNAVKEFTWDKLYSERALDLFKN